MNKRVSKTSVQGIFRLAVIFIVVMSAGLSHLVGEDTGKEKAMIFILWILRGGHPISGGK